MFHLGLRQTEGFVGSLLRLLDLDLDAPDHSTLSRRAKTLEAPRHSRRDAGPLHLVIDSTGLKLVGGGQWHAHKHGGRGGRRQWRMLHLGVDGDGYVVASALTESSVDDSSVGVELLGQLPAEVASFRADGAYDTRAVYDALTEVGAPELDIAIPPRRGASSSSSTGGAWRQREEAVTRIEAVGRRRWRKESGASQQARAENGMWRFKQLIGDRLRARTREGQTTEAMIGVHVLNRMTALGMPQSRAIRD